MVHHIRVIFPDLAAPSQSLLGKLGRRVVLRVADIIILAGVVVKSGGDSLVAEGGTHLVGEELGLARCCKFRGVDR